MFRTVSLVSCLGLLLSGCGGNPTDRGPSFGGPNGTITWTASSGNENSVPGIDQGAVFAIGKAFIVWGDATRGAGAGSGSTSSQGAEGDGYMVSHDGRKVEFRYSIKPDVSGRATVDGEDYDLANGNLFLVTDSSRFNWTTTSDGSGCRRVG